jgi:LysR family transcriptional regulator, transcriptional activator of nhaA
VDWLNYHHLLYFWLTAKEGSIVKASKLLYLTPPTVSAQIQSLEKSLGEKLLRRSGRRLVVTEAGQVAYRYANDIFSLGREMQASLKDRPTGRPLRLHVGINDVLPKLAAYRLLAPAFSLPETVQVICLEDNAERLLAQLAMHELDVVLSDAPATRTSSFRLFNHLLGECGVTFFGSPTMAKQHKRGFPRSLDGADFLLPTENTALRRDLNLWFESNGIRPNVRGEFQDNALLDAFGQAGLGLFVGPSAIEREICRQYDVQTIGRTVDVHERVYVISAERKLKHPAVVAISTVARKEFFI